MEDRQEIEITEKTRGIIVVAKSPNKNNNGFILLIDKVEPVKILGDDDLLIYTHVMLCVDMDLDFSFLDKRWGYTKRYGYKFYKPTEEDINKVKNCIRKRGLKYIRGVNKLIKR